MRMMITVYFDMQHAEKISALVPQEQEHVKDLLSQGKLEALYISADRTTVWLVLKGESAEEIQQELQSFPLYPYMLKPEFIPLV
jgi:muconolactone delta-isomerase